jgi:hypothetical protein
MDNTSDLNQETNNVAPPIPNAPSGKKQTSATEDFLAPVSETYAPKHMTWEVDHRSKSK